MKADDIPLPTRPGTTWDPKLRDPRGSYGLFCSRCGQGYSRHGAPEGEAVKFGVPLDKRHLICPASNEAWEEFNYQRRVADYESCRAEVIRTLEMLKGHDATVPLEQVVNLLPDHPEWGRKPITSLSRAEVLRKQPVKGFLK